MKRKEQLDQLGEMGVDELKDQADALKESLFRLKFRKTLGVGEVINDIRREKKRPFDLPSRNIGPPLMLWLVHFKLPKLVVSRFSLISRYTHRAHAVL